jgi:predicted dehydrogenase
MGVEQSIDAMTFLSSRLRNLWSGIVRPARSPGTASQPISPITEGPLRYAVFGAGSAARTHLTQILAKPDVTLVGIADPTPRTSWRIPKDLASAPHFADARRLLVETRPDVISICTPPKYHCDLTLLALRAGAHVICEKPMAMTIDEAERMERARAAAGKLGAINFSYRNLAAFRFARHVVARGELGALTRVSVAYLQSFLAAPQTLWSWRNDATIAGFGALGDLGVHMIDITLFITGLEFQHVVLLARTLVSEKLNNGGVKQRVTTDTHAMFLAELGSRTLGTFEATQMAQGYGDLFKVEISGEHGTLCADSEHPQEIRLHVSKASSRDVIWKTNLPVTELPTGPFLEGQPSPGALVDAIRGAEVDFPSFADGVATQRVLTALERSARKRAWVTIQR